MCRRHGLWRWGVGAVLVVGCVLGVAGSAWATTAYVTNGASNSVTPIELASNTPGAEIKVGREPLGVAITPDGKTAYVTNLGSNSVTPIDVASNTPGAEIKVGSGPFGVAITPDGKTAYVANFDRHGHPHRHRDQYARRGHRCRRIPGRGRSPPTARPSTWVTREHRVTPIDTASNTPGPEITVGTSRRDRDHPRRQDRLCGQRGQQLGDADRRGHNTPAPKSMWAAPARVAITPDGKTAYVTNEGSSSVTPIDIASNTPGAETLSGASRSGSRSPPTARPPMWPSGLQHVTPIDIATTRPGRN